MANGLVVTVSATGLSTSQFGFTDPTAHGTQASHAEAGTATLLVVVTLPVNLSSGTTFRIKNIGVTLVTITSANNIDASTSYQLNPYQYASVDVQWDGVSGGYSKGGTMFNAQLTKTLVLTPAQIKSLISSPTLLVAGKANQIINLHSCFMLFNPGGVPFGTLVDGDAITPVIGTGDNAIIINDGSGVIGTGFIDQTVPMGIWLDPFWVNTAILHPRHFGVRQCSSLSLTRRVGFEWH